MKPTEKIVEKQVPVEKFVDREVIKEVIKEVPVERIVEREKVLSGSALLDRMFFNK
jgi:glucokinase